MKERTGLEGVEAELMGESVQSLGIAGQRMEAALVALRAAALSSPIRAQLLEDAVQATYAYVVQRDALGLLDTPAALDLYQVPAEVRARLGVRRRAS